MAAASRAQAKHSEPNVSEPTQESRARALWAQHGSIASIEAEMERDHAAVLDRIRTLKQNLLDAQEDLKEQLAQHPLSDDLKAAKDRMETLKAQLLEHFDPEAKSRSIRTDDGNSVQFRVSDTYSVDDPKKLMEALVKDQTLYEGCRPAIQIEKSFAVPIAQRNMLPGVVAETKVTLAMVPRKD